MQTIAMLLALSICAACSEVDSSAQGALEEPDAGAHSTESAAAVSGDHKTRDRPSEPLCDGSDALRLGMVSEGGGQQYKGYEFAHPFGHSFFAIDGKCHFYAEDNYMHGVISGTLGADDAAQLSKDLHWNELNGWAETGIVHTGACFDAGATRLITGVASVGCSCSCDGGPSGLEDAVTETSEWLAKLTSQGKPLDGPVSALVLNYVFSMPATQPVLSWPLSSALDAVPDLMIDLNDARLRTEDGPWARFEAASDYTKLRELRALTAENIENRAVAILLRDGMLLRSLYVRDEPPAEFVQAWNELRAPKP